MREIHRSGQRGLHWECALKAYNTVVALSRFFRLSAWTPRADQWRLVALLSNVPLVLLLALGDFRTAAVRFCGENLGEINLRPRKDRQQRVFAATRLVPKMVPKPIDIDSVMIFPTGKCKIHRRYVTPGAEKNTSVDEPSPVHVRDARPIQDEIKLDTYGFQLVHHESKVLLSRRNHTGLTWY